MTNAIPIHESENSEKVVKFIELEHFTYAFQEAYNNNQVHGCYFDENGKIVYKDIWGDVEENII